jgi:periodic tryptophan protein 2
MKFNYKLHRLCGSVYGTPNDTNSTSSGGNIVYTSSGNVILSPVSNRVQVIDLLTHTVRTLSCEARSNIKTIALSPDDRLLIIVDDENHAMLVNFHRSVILHRFSFKKNVKVCQFSPCGFYFAVSYGNHIQVWHAPGLRREFSPFVLHRTYTGLGDSVIHISWSSDSSVIMASCKRGTVRIWTVDSVDGYEPFTLSGHKSAVVGAYFEKITPGAGGRLRKVYTVSADGALVSWSATYSDEDIDDKNKEKSFLESSNAAVNFFGGASNDLFRVGRLKDGEFDSTQAEHLPKATWEVTARHYFHQDADVTATNFEAKHNLLIVGFGSGIFGLYELPSMSNIHTLSLSNQIIRTVAINNTGEWLAFGCPSTQQLLVWEWRSETYIIKQRGHSYGMRCMSYSGDGVVVATGGEDGAIKLWNTSSGFCYCTLKSHTAAITAIRFSNSSVVMSASLDGTVRAHDLNRYRNFRTYTTPQPCQFTSLAVDPSGEVVVAGTMDPFHIYTWNVQSGKLLDILTGHVGPISELTFHPSRGTLASSSWDGIVKIWDLYKREGEPESFRHNQDVVCCTFRPDGKQMCTGTIGGILSIWDVDDGKLLLEIDGKRDIAGGRKVNDRMTSDNNAASRYFTSVCYSADGTCILAGGNSKYICIYEVSQQILVKKFQISFNRSLDGILDELNSKKLADGGPIDVNDSADEADFSANLPGAKRGDDGSRKSKVEVVTMQVAFSNTGREWAAVSNEGLHVYSLDDDMIFDPIALTEEITPGSVQSNLRSGNYSVALLISLHLNEFALVRQVLEETPFASIPHVVKSVSHEHLERLMQYIAKCMSDSPHLEFYMQWSMEMLKTHGLFLEKHRNTYMRAFRAMHRTVQTHHNELKRICDENRYTLDYVEDQLTINMNT